MKLSAGNISPFNPLLLLGIALYAVAGVLLVLALKRGDLSLVYPLIGLSYIWVTLSSIFFLHEQFAGPQGFGVAAIVIGVILINHSGRRR